MRSNTLLLLFVNKKYPQGPCNLHFMYEMYRFTLYMKQSSWIKLIFPEQVSEWKDMDEIVSLKPRVRRVIPPARLASSSEKGC